MNRSGCAALAAGLLLAPVFCRADQAPGVSVSVDRNEVRVGERIRYAVTVSHPQTTSAVLRITGSEIGGCLIERSGTDRWVLREGWADEPHWFEIACYETGSRELPAPTAAILWPDGAVEELVGEPVTIRVLSLLPEDWQSQDIKDIKGPVAARRSALWPALSAVLVALILGVAWLVWRRSKRQEPEPLRSPHEIARRELLSLRRGHWLIEEKFEPFYVELSAIVRRYIEGRFGLRAPEMTTEEFLQAAFKDAALSGAHHPLLGNFLGECDQVKFARFRPDRAQAEAALDAAARFVEETAPAPESAPSPTGPDRT